MRGLETLIRLHRWRVDEKRRKLADLQRMRDDFAAQIVRLEQEMARERELAGQSAEAGAAFPPWLAQALARQRTLQNSLEEIVRQIAVAEDELAAEFAEAKRYEVIAEDRERRARRDLDRRRQIELDETALERYRRAGNGGR